MCKKCGIKKNIIDFKKDNRLKDGCQNICKLCNNVKRKIDRKKNKTINERQNQKKLLHAKLFNVCNNFMEKTEDDIINSLEKIINEIKHIEAFSVPIHKYEETELKALIA